MGASPSHIIHHSFQQSCIYLYISIFRNLRWGNENLQHSIYRFGKMKKHTNWYLENKIISGIWLCQIKPFLSALLQLTTIQMQQISKLSLNSFSKLLKSCLIYLPPSLEDAFTLSLYWDDMIKTCVHNSLW